MNIGSHYLGHNNCEFMVWAPYLKQVALNIIYPQNVVIPMIPIPQGYWRVIADDIAPGTLYFYRLGNSLNRPDPASCYQPEGVHGPSKVIDQNQFIWQDFQWHGVALDQMIIYESHVGTFTPEGTFQAIMPRLVDLKELGITALELMPVGQFPGERNWGYDGVYPFAVQNTYGGPQGLKEFVDACHGQGMAVILDVVYSHFGPEGNYTQDYGPYLSPHKTTPWGQAINFDGPDAHGVRNFFIQNALFWFESYHIDALRLDSTWAMADSHLKPILAEITEAVAALSQLRKRNFYLIAETGADSSLALEAISQGGYGMHARWHDEFHHALHALLTGERQGYYRSFGKAEDLVKAIKDGHEHEGRMVGFSQNHDHVGNRRAGERLSGLVSFESLKLAAGMVILSSDIPLLFMGEEYAEQAPFYYFTSHHDLHVFDQSRLNWGQRDHDRHKVLLEFYRELIQIRRSDPTFVHGGEVSRDIQAQEDQGLIWLHQWYHNNHVLIVYNFSQEARSLRLDLLQTAWTKVIDSSEKKWLGQGLLMPQILEEDNALRMASLSFVLYRSIG